MKLAPELIVRVAKLRVHKCEKCPKTFPNLTDLTKHMSYHDELFLSHMVSAHVAIERAKIFKCDSCTKSFCTKKEFMFHKVEHIHKEMKDERKVTRFSPQVNILKPYKCPDCDYKFAVQRSLDEHYKLHLPFPHICDCGIGYYKQNDLKYHMRLVHGTEMKPKTDSITANVDEIVSNRKTNANKGPKLKAVLLKKKIHAKGKWKVKIKGKEVKPRIRWNIPNPNIHIRRTSDNKYECPQCKKLFSEKYHVIIHYRIHTGERPYHCELCPKTYIQSNTLQTHILSVHIGEKKYVCQYCPKAFFTPANRIRHEKIHSAIKQYDCPFCGKAFHDPSALVRHKRIHTGDKRYRCPYCPKAFTDISGLNGHKLRHEKNKRFKCDICLKKFYNRTDLNNHLAVHNQEKKYGCDICKKFYSTKTNLALHIDRHIPSKRFGCDWCGKKFRTKVCAQNHVNRVHRKKDKQANNFECNDCSKRFFSKTILIRHLQVEHSGVVCDMCSRYFLSERHLKEHELKTVAQCEICDEKFFCVNMEEKHLKKHCDVKKCKKN